MIQLCLASNNPKKISEIKNILGNSFDIKSLNQFLPYVDIPETGKTLEENSEIKAKYLFEKLKMPCIADDSGLEVETLDNEPGVYSARYAGEEKDDMKNIEKLLLKMIGEKRRNARFRTIITYIDQGGIVQFEGIIEGKIIHELRGKNGFGYDPIFIPIGHEKTFAEMNSEEKNALSHRFLALKKLQEYLRTRF
ncbi:MAG: RdgB/HAM1 family non-canonical purine NTP pyrophosphatase [Cytophagales bacterium]